MPASGNSRFRGYPARMSERQQLALILQMTSQEMTSGSSNRSENTGPLSNSRSSPLQHRSKSRWSTKNSDLIDGNPSFNRQDDRFRCESKDRGEFASSNSPDEVRTATGAESPVAAGSPAESAATVIPADSNSKLASEEADKGPSITNSSASSSSSHHPEDAAGASYEMRRTPPQNKVDRQTTSSSGGVNSNVNSSGSSATSTSSSSQQQQQQQTGSGGSRVTLRLNQVRSARDEKKVTASGAAAATGAASTTTANTATRQTGNSSAASSGSSSGATLSSSQMESSGAKSSGSGGSSSTISGANSSNSGGVSGGGGSERGGSNSNNGSSSSSADGGDVYEFKSSKEATPVRGSSTSPNPNPDKEGKDPTSSVLSSPTGSGQGQGNSATSSSGNAGVTGSMGSNLNSTTPSCASSGIGSSSASSAGTSTSAEALSASITSAMSDETMINTSSPRSSSPSNKRSYENDGAQDDQDEEGRKRKKKESESNKEVGGAKGATGGRQTAARNSSASVDKQCNKSAKQPSPSSSLNANSPKPSSSNNPKGSTTSTESDGEDDRSKSSDCSMAPKVPPLKLVVQTSNSEPEQGNRNGKNTSNRSHQLHYVVASSNSNDSMDKDQIMSGATSGATSPLDGSGGPSKNEDKKDFSGALDGESRSTHHQRVLRSSHRSGNGGNGSSSGRETSGNVSGSGNYSNSSPLSVNAADRSNNSSPQQRYNSPPPESGRPSETGKSMSMDSSNQNSPAVKSSNASEKCEKGVEVKKEPMDPSEINIKKENASDLPSTSSQAPVEFHPRKRKIKTSKEAQQAAAAATASVNETIETTNSGPEIHPHDQPITNCIELYMNIRKQIQHRRKGLFPVKPKPPQGFKNYLLNRCTYMLAGNANEEPNVNPPGNLNGPMKDLYISQEKERYNLRMQHVVEKEKLVLAKEQEIIRVHGRAARALANQELPFSACTFLKDEEVYNLITPEQEEKDRNARSRYTGRMFISWLQDVDDKWEKIKEGMILRHHNEAESLHAVQRMDWEWKLKEVGLCEFKVTPNIDKLHVPIVHVSDDFDLLPA